MINETALTVIGNLTASPGLRYTTSGVPFTDFTVASTSRVQDGPGGRWRDGQTLFVHCQAWRQVAEHLTTCLHKGDRVVVTGRLHERNYRTETGEQRSGLELLVDDVGVSLRYTSVTPGSSGRSDERGGNDDDDLGATA